MLFPILIAVVAVAFIVYVATRKSKHASSYTAESTVSIHEEIAKTVEEAKSLAPIVDEVSKPKAKKQPSTPKAKKTATPTMAAKKQAPKKSKTTVNA